MIAKVTTLREIETHYDLVDMLDLHEALDIQEEAERMANEVPHGS